MLFAALLLFAAQETAPTVESLGHCQNPALREISGLAQLEEGLFWALNDSGGEPRLYAFTEDGATVGDDDGVLVEGARNVDWEALATLGSTLVVADVGNNGNARRDLGLYLVDALTPGQETVRSRFVPLRYPDQEEFPAEDWRFDCEAVFGDGDALWFLTKHRRPGQRWGLIDGTKLYRLRRAEIEEAVKKEAPAPLPLTLVAEREDVPMPTGAALSPDGRRLAIASYGEVVVFTRPAATAPGSAESTPASEGASTPAHWLSGEPLRIPLPTSRTGQIESVAWRDATSLLLANEPGGLFVVRLRIR